MSFRIQSDWLEAAKEATEPFWISCQTEEVTLVGSLKSKGQSIISETEDFHVIGFDPSPAKLRVFCKPLNKYATFTPFTREYKILNAKGVCKTDINHQGDLGVTGGTQNNVVVWSTTTGKILFDLEGHVLDINTCKFFPSGEVVLSGSSDMRLKIWSATQGYCAATLVGHAGGVLGCDFVGRGRNLISCARDGTVKLWDVPSSSVIKTYKPSIHSAAVDCLLFENAPKELINSGRNAQENAKEFMTEGCIALCSFENGSISAFDLRSTSEVWSCQLPDGHASSITKSDENTIISGSSDGILAKWDIRSKREPICSSTRRGFPVNSIAPLKNADDKFFWTGYGDGHSILWNNNLNESKIEVAGPSLDPVYSTQARNNQLYATSRNGAVYKTNISHLLQ